MTPAFDLSAAIEAIADKVHQGWMQEKLAQGFADHPYYEQSIDGLGTCCVVCYDKTSKEKHHTDMLPYAKLPEHVKEYDRKTARMVFQWLEENGYVINKRSEVARDILTILRALVDDEEDTE